MEPMGEDAAKIQELSRSRVFSDMQSYMHIFSECDYLYCGDIPSGFMRGQLITCSALRFTDAHWMHLGLSISNLLELRDKK